MKKSEMIRYISAADGFPDHIKALAITGIAVMPKVKFDEFSTIADRALRMLESSDYDGIAALMDEIGASEDIRGAVSHFITAMKDRQAGM